MNRNITMSSFLIEILWRWVIIKKYRKTMMLDIFSFFIYMIIIFLLKGFIYTVVGIGFLSFLGFQYDSYLSAIVFLVICYLIVFPADYYISFLVSLFKTKSNISFSQQRCIDFILYISFTSLIVGIVDYFMDSIIISPTNQILFVLLCYLLDVFSDLLFLNIMNKN